MYNNHVYHSPRDNYSVISKTKSFSKLQLQTKLANMSNDMIQWKARRSVIYKLLNFITIYDNYI